MNSRILSAIIVLSIVIIVSIIIFICNFCYKQNNLIEGLNTFNGRMAIDDQYFYDKLFDDVIYYPNEYERDYNSSEEIGKLITTGWIRCKEECPGHCMEYGITGASYCFPKPVLPE